MMTNARELISQNLATLIRCSGKPVADIAKGLEVSPSLVSKYLSGAALPSVDKLPRLCEILNCNYDDVFSPGEQNPH